MVQRIERLRAPAGETTDGPPFAVDPPRGAGQAVSHDERRSRPSLDLAGEIIRRGHSVSRLARAVHHSRPAVTSALRDPVGARLDLILRLLEAAGARELRLEVAWSDDVGPTCDVITMSPPPAKVAMTDARSMLIVRLPHDARRFGGAEQLRDRAQRWWRLNPRTLADRDPQILVAVVSDMIVGAWTITGFRRDQRVRRYEVLVGDVAPELIGLHVASAGSNPVSYWPRNGIVHDH